MSWPGGFPVLQASFTASGKYTKRLHSLIQTIHEQNTPSHTRVHAKDASHAAS